MTTVSTSSSKGNGNSDRGSKPNSNNGINNDDISKWEMMLYQDQCHLEDVDPWSKTDDDTSRQKYDTCLPEETTSPPPSLPPPLRKIHFSGEALWVNLFPVCVALTRQSPPPSRGAESRWLKTWQPKPSACHVHLSPACVRHQCPIAQTRRRSRGGWRPGVGPRLRGWRWRRGGWGGTCF